MFWESFTVLCLVCFYLSYYARKWQKILLQEQQQQQQQNQQSDPQQQERGSSNSADDKNELEILGDGDIIMHDLSSQTDETSSLRRRASQQVQQNGNALFQRWKLSLLWIYLSMQFAILLQEPYLYTLYRSYGLSIKQISLLFIIVYASSASIGGLATIIADIYNRKQLAYLQVILFCASTLLKLSALFPLLVIGRILDGISMSLFIAVYEVWMVSEYQNSKSPFYQLADTFISMGFYTPLLGILAGVISHQLVDSTKWYQIPYLFSLLWIVFALLTLRGLSESGSTNNRRRVSSILTACIKSLNLFRLDKRILCIGLNMVMFESVQIVWAFLFGPVLSKDESSIPFTLVYACMMVSRMCGNAMFSLLTRRQIATTASQQYNQLQYSQILLVCSLVGCSALAIPVLFNRTWSVFLSFAVLNVAFGACYPALALLRTKYFNQDIRTTLMVIVRTIVNIIVVLFLINVSLSTDFILVTSSVLLVAAFVCSYSLSRMFSL
ncbi:hypothetical protein MP228_005239 [Amoeboaphelidium protococcarum]|nr:hypothetical protein MP228_005239 [Amoeboaphelidium protococcarum]